MSAAEIRDDRNYTVDHEWAMKDGEVLVVGITAFAVDQLGDITMVQIDVSPGDHIKLGKAFGTVESVKTLSDLFAPISGTVRRVNDRLEEEPELINDDCWEEGWMIAIEPDAADSGIEKLLDVEGYRQHVDSDR